MLFVTSKHTTNEYLCVCVCVFCFCVESLKWANSNGKKRAKILLQCILYYNKTMMGEATNT